MGILVGGVAAAVIGIIWAVAWWPSFLSVLGGLIPTFLLMGGAIAIYFGIDELRYPPPESPPATEEPPEKVPSSSEEKKNTIWLAALSTSNVEVVRDHGVLSLPDMRGKALKERMQVGDFVVLYALAPQSRFAGIVRITGEPVRIQDSPFKSEKEGERWEWQREVHILSFPSQEEWVEARTLLQELELLHTAKEEGKDLLRSFAAKLRDVLELSESDFQRIQSALPPVT